MKVPTLATSHVLFLPVSSSSIFLYKVHATCSNVRVMSFGLVNGGLDGEVLKLSTIENDRYLV